MVLIRVTIATDKYYEVNGHSKCIGNNNFCFLLGLDFNMSSPENKSRREWCSVLLKIKHRYVYDEICLWLKVTICGFVSSPFMHAIICMLRKLS